MRLEIVREHRRYRATDEDGLAIGYGGTLQDAVMRWAQNWDEAMNAKSGAHARARTVQRLDASIA